MVATIKFFLSTRTNKNWLYKKITAVLDSMRFEIITETSDIFMDFACKLLFTNLTSQIFQT